MNFDRNPRFIKANAAGFTLIELMIAVTLMLMVTFAVISIYLPTRSTAKVQTGVARMNENWQVASENIAREFRELSSNGCVPLGDSDDGHGNSNIKHYQIRGNGRAYSDVTYNNTTALKQVSSSDPSAPADAIAGQPILVVNHAANGGAHLRTLMPDRGASGITLAADPHISNYTTGDLTATQSLAVITNCKGGEIFQIKAGDGVGNAASFWKITPTTQISAPYGVDARIAALTTTQFYLAPATRATGERTTTALYRRTLKDDGVNWNTASPVARDVTSMQITAAIDTNGDHIPEAANVPWNSALASSQVVAINLTLGMTGPPDTKANGTALVRSFTAYITARAKAL